MITPTELAVTAATANLRRLAMIRFIALAGQIAGLLYASYSLQAALNYPALLGTVAALAAVNALTLWRLRRRWPLTDAEFSLQLGADILWLTVALYFSGGATNPFVSYYLVPISVAAAALPWTHTWAITGACLGAYTLMLFFYQPLPALMPHRHGSAALNLHVVGMWCNFAVSAVLITYFVVKMAKTVREQQAQLNRQREEDLRNEQILAVATIAAGTAHELGTPLSTMTILVDDLVTEQAHDPTLQNDLKLLQQQLHSCRDTLQSLTTTAQAHSRGQRESLAADRFIRQVLEHWQVIRPRASFTLRIKSTPPAPMMAVDTTLEQAIINYLNNGADACDQPLAITLDWDSEHIDIGIRDRGPGLTRELQQQAGQAFVSEKGKGRGLGLFLSHATIERFGGQVALYAPEDGGTLVEISLPYTRESES